MTGKRKVIENWKRSWKKSRKKSWNLKNAKEYEPCDSRNALFSGMLLAGKWAPF